MRVLIATPTETILDRPDAQSVIAEDETGSFGIHSGHADFITVLAICVVVWRGSDGASHYVAVHGGVMSVTGGAVVRIATREAVAGVSLDDLEKRVLTRFRRSAAAEESERARANALHVAALQHVWWFLNPDRRPAVLDHPASSALAP